MKKLYLISIFLLFAGFSAFGQGHGPEQEEIDYLLFLPNSSDLFVDEEQALAQLDNMAKFLLGRDIAPGQINVYGYAAFAANDIDPVHLSRNRAHFVINELQKRGVPRGLFSEPTGHGSVDLWGNNINEEDKSPNRRARVVLDGNLIVVETATGQVRESEAPPPAEPEPEIAISSIDSEETSIRHVEPIDNSGKKFPWWVLLPLLLLLLLPFFLSKRRKKSSDGEKTTRHERVEKPAAPVVSAPVAPAPAKAAPAPAHVAPAAAPAPTPAPKPVAPVAAGALATGESVVYIEEEIRRRAYEYYQMRNGENGTMDDDWYKALPEICGKYEAVGYKTYSDGSWWAKKSFSKKS